MIEAPLSKLEVKTQTW